MLQILKNRTFRHLYLAQVISLVGTGLATVALGLLAWKLAGKDAGLVLGTALAIKMIAYVALAPLASALATRLPRRAFLVALDLIRAVVVVFLPFVSEVWQIYVLIFLLQAASAGFTPAFQATIPDVLPEERDYTKALSLMRLAEDLEQVLSPMLAAALLTLVSFPVLFGGTVVGFVASALLVVSIGLPRRIISHGHPEGPSYLSGDPAPARPYGDGNGRRRCRSDGLCQHGGSGAGPAWAWASGGGAGFRSLWGRVDAGSPEPAESAGNSGRSPCHADRSGSDGGNGWFGAAGLRIVGSFVSVGADRVWLCADPNPNWSHPEPFGPAARPPCRLRRPIRLVPRLLAGHLPGGRLDRRSLRAECSRCEPGGNRRNRDGCSPATVAIERPVDTATQPHRPAC
jgi:MFS family permease